ncbi:MAG: flavodoxin family protein [Planctomycetaceae bacterium]|nr:flavodoxin family protein [Planctomycetaceae bacterium]
MSKKILAIVGTYRKGGITDSAVDEILSAAQENGCETEKIYLLDKHLEFCTNCRKCTQMPGEHYGKCVLNDDLDEILQKIENADGFILASPINFYNVTALMRKFIERLVCFAYWPWGKSAAPKLRSKVCTKNAVYITATAMPAIMQILLTGGPRILKTVAKLLGAKKVIPLVIGTVAANEKESLPKKYVLKARKAGKFLAAENF